MKRISLFVLPVLVSVLFIATVSVWSAVLASTSDGKLTVAFLDVGQGDAIFIQAPNGVQVLIDGGKGGAVLAELGSLMPFRDRSIDVVIATHPDLDHIGGLPAIFARYEVGMYIESGVEDGGEDHAALLRAVAEEGLTPMYARQGMTLMLDHDVTLAFLFPDRSVTHLEPNAASVVVQLRYKDTSVLLTGDTPASIEDYLITLYQEQLKSDILKLGHHGSKTSTGEAFIGFVDPEYGIISAGCGNPYGHPHAEVMDRLARFAVHAKSTCELGTIVFRSNGLSWTLR